MIRLKQQEDSIKLAIELHISRLPDRDVISKAKAAVTAGGREEARVGFGAPRVAMVYNLV